MYSLFIDTHSSNIIIILFKDGKILSKLEQESVNQHSVFALNMVKDILLKNNLEIDNLNEIIAVNGPGSFTGIRIGMTIAKTIAFTMNIPIKLIDSLVIKAVNVKSDIKYVSLEDRHGAFIAKFDKDNKLVDNFRYVGNKEYNLLSENNEYVNSVDIDYEKVYEYSKSIDYVAAHSANPLYVKNVEV